MAILSPEQVQERLAALPHWTLEGKAITREQRFKDFIEAIQFVNQLVAPAEAANHHPDLAISYNRVTITLTTHDAGGLTDKDFDLAQTFDQLTS